MKGEDGLARPEVRERSSQWSLHLEVAGRKSTRRNRTGAAQCREWGGMGGAGWRAGLTKNVASPESHRQPLQRAHDTDRGEVCVRTPWGLHGERWGHYLEVLSEVIRGVEMLFQAAIFPILTSSLQNSVKELLETQFISPDS